MVTVTAHTGFYSNPASYRILAGILKISPWVPKFTKGTAGDLLKKRLWILFFPSMITKMREQVPASESFAPGGEIQWEF